MSCRLSVLARDAAGGDDAAGGAPLETVAFELVVAASENGVIGRGNSLPWHLPKDLQRFKALTLGKHVLMGRKTYESIGKALPGRTNWVLSRAPDFSPGDCTVVASLSAARPAPAAESLLLVIGGAEIYRQCLPLARRIHLTLVHAQVGGDAFFGEWRSGEWRESSRQPHAADAKHAFDYSFITLERC